MATNSGGDQKSDENSTQKSSYDPTLDFFSEKFDPLKALRTPGIVPPVINAKTYDNLAKYECAYLQSKNQQVNKAGNSKIKVLEDNIKERRWLPHQLPTQSNRPINSYKNVLTRMELIEGPLTVLRKCKDERIKIKVWTRHSHDIRGYCIGFVTLFDKHWNLVLEDITEVWTRKKRRKIPAALDFNESGRKVEMVLVPPPVKIVKCDKKTETCERHVDQFLIRGEQIAIIAVLDHND